MGRAHLGGLLPDQRGPQAQLAVPLEGGGLGVEAPGEDHVAEVADEVRGGAGELEVVVLDASPVGGQQLHHVLALTAHAASFH